MLSEINKVPVVAEANPTILQLLLHRKFRVFNLDNATYLELFGWAGERKIVCTSGLDEEQLHLPASGLAVTAESCRQNAGVVHDKEVSGAKQGGQGTKVVDGVAVVGEIQMEEPGGITRLDGATRHELGRQLKIEVCRRHRLGSNNGAR